MSASATIAWICSVCGHIHYGSEPPEECPVCGATSDQFEREAAPLPQAPASPTLVSWVCLVCGTIHVGVEPPAECPVCGAPGDQFEPEDKTPVAQAAPVASRPPFKVLIAGAGIAGVAAAEALRKTAPEAEIVLLSNEANLPYYRLNLTRYLAGEVSSQDLILHSPDWYETQRIQLRRETSLESLDLAQKSALLSNGSHESFDRLVLALGSSPFIPPVAGVQRKNVFSLRTQNDADALLDACRGGRSCACIGGGLLGLESAGALARQGVMVTIYENQAWLLPRQLNPAASRLFQIQVEALGIRVITFARVRELAGEEKVRRVVLDNGESLPAEVVLFSAGVRSNLSLVKNAGLETNLGVLVNDHMQTSHPDVFAAGDLCEHRGVLYGTWAPAQFQGAVAGQNAAQTGLVEFSGIPRSNTLKVLGIDLFSVGKIAAESDSDLVIEGELDGNFAFFLFQENRLAGSILLGDASLSMRAKKLVESRADCSALLAKNPSAREILDFMSQTE